MPLRTARVIAVLAAFGLALLAATGCGSGLPAAIPTPPVVAPSAAVPPTLQPRPPVVITAAPPAAPSSPPPTATPSPTPGAFTCSTTATVEIGSDVSVWSPLALRFAGPPAAEGDAAPNPFLDYRLTVRFVGPSGRPYDVPGYFAGDGQGGAGNQWVARFAADEPGEWRYCASFRAGAAVAVDLDPLAGAPASFDGAGGAFVVAPAAPDAPGFYKWGRLEYAGGHYLKFRDGPYWIKGGSNSPENFLAYTGFEDTFDAGGNVSGFLHAYASHVADWREGDPTLPGAADDGMGIIGALNYLSDQGVNSLYFLTMNLGGDGGDTWPFLSPEDVTHYDVGKLAQWRVVFEHAQRRGVALQIVLNETEPENRAWLDREPAAGGGISIARRLYYRELVARFADLPAIKWNLSEENVFTRDESLAYASYLGDLDWAGHPIAFHNPAGWTQPYAEVLGAPQFSATSMQYLADDAGALVEAWRAASAAAGRPWVIDMDENQPAQEGLTADNAGPLRKEILYDVLFSGGNIEWYAGYHDLPLGGDLNLENFRTREAMWAAMRHARRFLEENTPFWQMVPADALLVGEAQDYGGGEVFALPGRVYAIYLPLASDPATLIVPPGRYSLRWYDPRDGLFPGPPQTQYVAGRLLPLGPPPYNPGGDWVMLVTAGE